MCVCLVFFSKHNLVQAFLCSAPQLLLPHDCRQAEGTEVILIQGDRQDAEQLCFKSDVAGIVVPVMLPKGLCAGGLGLLEDSGVLGKLNGVGV